MSRSWLQIGFGTRKEGRKEGKRLKEGVYNLAFPTFHRCRGLDAQRSQLVPGKASGSAAVELVLSDSTRHCRESHRKADSFSRN